MKRWVYGSIELAFVIVSAAGAALWCYSHVGGPASQDAISYMGIAMNLSQDPWVLNRYTHIYLLKLFMWLAGGTFAGAKGYWCFLVSASCVLVYFSAKRLSAKAGATIGIYAVLMFLAQETVFNVAGEAWADFCLMFMIMVNVFLYLHIQASNGRRRIWLLILFGIGCVIAFKAKESGLCLAALLAGFGRNCQGTWTRQFFFRDAKNVIAGVLAGLILFVFLDGFFLGDPWFSFRPSHWIECMNTSLGHYEGRNSNSYYLLFAYSLLGFTVTLYLMGILDIQKRDCPFAQKILWSLPLFFLVFLQITMIPGKYCAIRRYFFPVIPVVCLWAANILNFFLPERLRKEVALQTENGEQFSAVTPSSFVVRLHRHMKQNQQRVTFCLLVFLAGVMSWSIYNVVIRIGRDNSWDAYQLHGAMIVPTAFTFLLLARAFAGRGSWRWAFIALMCFNMAFVQRVIWNYEILRARNYAIISENHFKPYEVFAAELSFTRDATFLISDNVYGIDRALERDAIMCSKMFNIFFEQKSDPSQFHLGNVKELFDSRFTYCFFTEEEWKALRKDPKFNQIEPQYEILSDPYHRFVLLKSLP
jgi:hypothetical protein